MKYYKIIHKGTGVLMCYIECSSYNAANEVCKIFGIDEYFPEEINEEEYRQVEAKIEGYRTDEV